MPETCIQVCVRARLRCCCQELDLSLPTLGNGHFRRKRRRLLSFTGKHLTPKHMPPNFLRIERWIFLALMVPIDGLLLGQTTIELGTGTFINDQFESPSPYGNALPGSRHQLLFPASELQAAGMTVGSISGLGFHVFQPSTGTLEGFSIRIGSTTANSLTNTWETGGTTVWGPQNYQDTAGWSMHEFSDPFEWDGVSNVYVETCFANASITTQNAQMYLSFFAFNACVSRISSNPTICTDPGGQHEIWQRRPNVRFIWSLPQLPPIAMPAASPQFSCTGSVTFRDQNTSLTDTRNWDLGDGTTSLEESFTHTYTASGVYEVVLISTNDFGSDTATITVTIDLDVAIPQPACAIPSSGDVAGFGILQVDIEGVQFMSDDALSEGYLDNTCQAITVTQGTPLDLSVTTATASSHAVRAWLDLDNSGTFTANELILTGTGPMVTSNYLVGSGVILDTPLRLRIVAAYDLVTPAPLACGTVQFGQAEDYSIVVVENTAPPEASFMASPLFSCNGSVQFTDSSLNAPTAWSWTFGDGGTSDERDPLHTYISNGTYTVTLTAINANGEDTSTSMDLVVVDLAGQLGAATCAPNTQSYCCGYGILGFQFAGINVSSPDASEGYQDRSCGNVAEVTEGESFNWSLTTGGVLPHDVRIWMDFDNDGELTPNELVATELDRISPSGTVSIPFGVVLDTPLRLRVQADVIGQSMNACDAPLLGQVEDYTVVIAGNTSPPTAAFSGTPEVTCDGNVQFTDLSTTVPTSWLWDFGDGTTSEEQDPIHVYAALGMYSVSLTATNAFGTSTVLVQNYITVIPEWQCETFVINSQTDQSNDACLGVLADNGGPNGNYLPGNSGAYTIAPIGAEVVTLQFTQFAWGINPNRFLAIHDGPTVASPLLWQLTGNGVDQLPNGGFFISSGPSITLRQQGSGGPSNSAGFRLVWNCSLTGINEPTGSIINRVYPVPAFDGFVVELGPSKEQRTITILSLTGQLMEQRAIPSNVSTVRFERSGLASGVYAIHVRSGAVHSTGKLIIQ